MIEYQDFFEKLAELIAERQFDDLFALFDSYVLEPEEFSFDIITKKAEFNQINDLWNSGEMTKEEFQVNLNQFNKKILAVTKDYKHAFPLSPKTKQNTSQIDHSDDIFKALLKLNYDQEYKQIGKIIQSNKKACALVFNRFNDSHYLGFLKLISIFNKLKLARQNFRIFTRTAYEFDKPVDDQTIVNIVNTWQNDKSVLIVWNLKSVPSKNAETNLSAFWQRIAALCRQKQSNNYLIFMVLAESIEGDCPACFKEQPEQADLDADAFIYSVLPDKFLKDKHIEPWLSKISDDFVGIFDLPDAAFFDAFEGNPGQIVFEFCEYAGQKINYQKKLYDQLIEQNFQNWKRDE